jgi:dihydropyrimidinase
MYDLCLKNGTIYLNGEFVNSNLYIKDGKIFDITKSNLDSKYCYDVSGKMILPGFIDPHVHFNLNVGKYTSVDDFHSGSVSAAYGGITTIIDFLDPVSDIASLEKSFQKRIKDAKKCIIDYAFHNTIANPTDEPIKIIEASKKHGLSSIKLFTTYSDSNRRTYDGYIFELLKLSKEKKIIITSHTENDDIIKYLNRENVKIKDLTRSRPPVSEIAEIMKLSEMTKIANGQLYIVHTSSGYSLEEVKRSFSQILKKNLHFESCPHYFYFTEEQFGLDNGYLYTLCPPFKSAFERKSLTNNIDLISTVGTDHCPFYKEDKKGIYTNEVPMGIGGVEFSFSLMYTIFGNKVIDKYTKNVAKIFGLYPKKGNLFPGADADIVIFDNNLKWKVNGHHSNGNYNVYDGLELKGKVLSTISKGTFIIKDGQFVNETKGSFIPRGDLIWE